MSFDNHVNLLTGTVQTPPSPSTTGGTLTLMPGDGSRFQPHMPVTLCPPNVQPLFDNSEIGYVTAVIGDQLTINRAQEGTIAKQVAGGWSVIAGITAKTITDVEAALDKHFEQAFTTAISVTVAHNLGKKPAVTVIDSAGDEVVGMVNHVSDNELVATFSAPFSGVLYCN